MLGEAAEKLGFKARGEDRGVGVGGQAAGDAGATVKEEDGPPVVAELKNRAGESRSPYVSCSLCCCLFAVEVSMLTG